MTLREVARVVLKWEHLQRTGLITLIVGTWLTMFNHGDVLMTGAQSEWITIKILLNYVTPFVVSNAGLVSRQDVGQSTGSAS